MRCPVCGQKGSFEMVPGGTDLLFQAHNLMTGQRRCPDPQCHAHVFVIYNGGPEVVASYPPEVIDFDATNVPTNVVAALEEAITCHANECYVAAAIMVRKTLEELCADREATGDNLKERIAALGTKVVIPQELLE